MNDLLCAIKTFVLSIVTARDVIIASAFLGLAFLVAWLLKRPQRKKNDERWERLFELLAEKATNASRGVANDVWEIARPGEPIPQIVQTKMDNLAAGAAQTILTGFKIADWTAAEIKRKPKPFDPE